jgi:hypothetical protein
MRIAATGLKGFFARPGFGQCDSILVLERVFVAKGADSSPDVKSVLLQIK